MGFFSTGFSARGTGGVSTTDDCGVFAGFVSTGMGVDFAGVLRTVFSRSAGFGAMAGMADCCFAELIEGSLFAVFANVGFVSTCTSAAGFDSVFVGAGVAGADGGFFTGLSGCFVPGFCFFVSCVVVAGCVTVCGAAGFSAGLLVAGFGLSLRSTDG